MVSPRRGVTKLGCLVGLLILATVVYFGVNVGEVYWRYFQFKDDMTQQLRFASHNTNEQIARHMAAVADSLGLPEAAGRVFIRRTGGSISIESQYYERIELPLFVRDVHFHPRVAGSF
jgi:hypothetical protein